MHELAICQALVGELTAIAEDQNAATISDVYVTVGPLSGVEPQLLANAFPIAAAGSAAERAELHLMRTDVRVHCDDCDTESDVDARRLVCRHCGSWRTRLIAGDELLLARVELERATPTVRAKEHV